MAGTEAFSLCFNLLSPLAMAWDMLSFIYFGLFDLCTVCVLCVWKCVACVQGRFRRNC